MTECAVHSCMNRSDNKERWVVMSHVSELSFHTCTDPSHCSTWTESVLQGDRRRHAEPITVCSNHFPQGRPVASHPFPVLYLRGYEDGGEGKKADVPTFHRDTDHDYPKVPECELAFEDVDSVSFVEVVELEDTAVEVLPSPHRTAEGRSVKDSSEQKIAGNVNRKKRKSVRSKPDNHHITIVHNDNNKPSCSQDGAHVISPHLISSIATSNSVIEKQNRRFSKRKRNNPNRDTDHMYNTRKSKCLQDIRTKNRNSEETDHLYNARKTKPVKEFIPRNPRNRDTDHMYNMPRSKRFEHKPSETGTDVKSVGKIKADKRVVDKDHMYQHSVRKDRNRLENRRWANTKAPKPKRSETDHTYEDVTQVVDTSEDNFLQKKHDSSSSRIRCSRNTQQESVCKQKAHCLSKDIDIVEGCDPELDYKTAVIDRDHMYQHSVTPASPVHSDNDSDHVCDDDSRRTGVGHTDHLYVHLSSDILETKEQPSLAPCFSVEGYKQEHSYANSEEVHYDACLNCSGLVQQLIGTIQQQGDLIEDLKKKLLAANARNKQLTLLVGQKVDSVD